MSLQKNKPETIDDLIKYIDEVILSIEHIGGYNALNEYGRGQHEMMVRMVQKLKSIQKASEDAFSKDEKLES